MARLILAVLLFSGFSLAAGAQHADSLRVAALHQTVGSMVRVSTPAVRRTTGRLVDTGSEFVQVDTPDGYQMITFGSHDSLWVREPLGDAAIRNGAIGGIVAGGAMLLFLRSTCGSGDDPCTGFGRAVPLVISGCAAIGAVTGVILGPLVKRWVRVQP